MLNPRWYVAVLTLALGVPAMSAAPAANAHWETATADPLVTNDERAGDMMTRAEPVVDTTYPLIEVRLDGQSLQTKGLLMQGRTLLPVRELVEGLGGKVHWDSHHKTIWAAFPAQERTVRMIINAPTAEIHAYDANDPHRMGKWIETIRLDQAPVLLGGRVVAPVAAAAAVAGAKVFWDAQAKIVSVERPSQAQAAIP